MKMATQQFKKLPLQQHPRLSDYNTAENRYWQKFQLHKPIKQIGPVTCIDFCPDEDSNIYAVTCASRIHLYDTQKNEIKRSFTRFEDIVYSGTFRKDGKLLVAGGQKPEVKVLDTNSRAILRTFQGHVAAIRSTKFSSNNIHIFSCSDDKTVRLWDLPTQKAINVVAAHSDYVRCSEQVINSDFSWISGSYDHTVKLWDFREGSSSSGKATLSINHGHPVESCTILPGGSLVVSAGGNEVKIWDILSGGKLVHTFSSHQKTITTVKVDGTGTRLLTGALDGHIKLHDLKTYKVTHGFKYNHGVLSMGISPLNLRIVVGTSDSNMYIREKKINALDIESQKANDDVIRGGTYQYFVRGKNTKPSQGDFVVQATKNCRLADYDKALRAFNYKEALDCTLATRSPQIVGSMLEELRMRAGLEKALSGRDEITLEPLISFLVKYLANPKYSALLVLVSNMIFNIYSSILGQSTAIDSLFFRLQNKLKEEIKLQKKLLGLLGVMDTLMAAQTTSRNTRKEL